MSDNPTVEIVIFKLKENVSEAGFLPAADAVEPSLKKMSGFINRQLLKGENGHWIDMVHWESLAEAQQANEAIMQESCAIGFMSMLDETNLTMLHGDTVLSTN